jgi:hypothetical protein
MIEESRSSAIGELLAESLRAGNAIRIRVNGTSMLPAIWPGDVLTVAPAMAPRPSPGDVALTAIDGRLLAHRVVERKVCGGAVAVVTRGDALESSDQMATGTQILGTVVARNGGELAAPRAARLTMARLVMRSAPLLTVILKARALTRGHMRTAA